MRDHVLVVLGLLAASAATEVAGQQTCSIELSVPAMLHRLQMKQAYTAVASLGLNAICFPDTMSQRVIVEMDQPLVPSLLLGVFLDRGLPATILSVNGEPWSEEAALRSDPPSFVATGDPAHDNAVYETAKAAWIRANRAAYEEAHGTLEQ